MTRFWITQERETGEGNEELEEERMGTETAENGLGSARADLLQSTEKVSKVQITSGYSRLHYRYLHLGHFKKFCHKASNFILDPMHVINPKCIEPEKLSN